MSETLLERAEKNFSQQYRNSMNNVRITDLLHKEMEKAEIPHSVSIYGISFFETKTPEESWTIIEKLVEVFGDFKLSKHLQGSTTGLEPKWYWQLEIYGLVMNISPAEPDLAGCEPIPQVETDTRVYWTCSRK